VIWCEVQSLVALDEKGGDPSAVNCAPTHVLRLRSVPGPNNPVQIVQVIPPPHVGCADE
jgi:hypothetical protein